MSGKERRLAVLHDARVGLDFGSGSPGKAFLLAQDRSRCPTVMSCVCSMQHVEAVQQEVGALSAQYLPGHGKGITIDFVGRLPHLNKGGRFCRSRPFRFSKMAILYQVDSLAEFCFKNVVVYSKNMLQSSIIVHRALSLICLRSMPLWSLTGANEEDPHLLFLIGLSKSKRPAYLEWVTNGSNVENLRSGPRVNKPAVHSILRKPEHAFVDRQKCFFSWFQPKAPIDLVAYGSDDGCVLNPVSGTSPREAAEQLRAVSFLENAGTTGRLLI